MLSRSHSELGVKGVGQGIQGRKEEQIPGLLWMIHPQPAYSILYFTLMGSGIIKMLIVPP